MINQGILQSQFVRRYSKNSDIDISVFIPVYNGALSLPELIQRIDDVLSNTNYSYEYVLVDDGSSDNSWEVISTLHESRDNLCAFRHLRNLGYNFTLQHGLEYCVGEWVLTLDDDLQHLPEEIPKLLKVIEDDPTTDVVFGAFVARQHKMWRNLGSTAYLKMIRALYGLPKDLFITSFRLINRRVIDQVIHSNLAEPQAGFMILKATRRIKNASVKHGERKYGESGIRISKMIKLTFDLLLHHTTLPLQLITGIGITAFFTSIILAIYYLSNYFFTQVTVSGFTTLVLMLLAFGGLTLFSIGIVGFYVSRLLRQVTFTPVYSVRNFLPPKNLGNNNDR
jgi:dolichol-phosphate mannosyltransferase/undecaprenyl-phosphate 4-deoxy-4-formamido-L-arabinose transferase